MSHNKRPPQPPQPPQQPQMDPALLDAALRSAPIVQCEACQNATFEEVIMFKAMSALVSPTGKAGLFPFNVVSCNACGHVNHQFLPSFMKNVQEVSPGTVATPPSILKLEK
jgi:hypothetical protein